MSEEEMKAIECLKEYLDNVNSNDRHKANQYNDNYGYVTMQFTPFGNIDLEILLNLIEKQQNTIHILAKELTRFYDETEEDIIKKLSKEK